ncbi:I78 family peptidase inhibitor [Altererythrobacter ishigakiensis]|nr:I78 family peptidase inhibitor [Altererythrobacter ishigakiensis]
MRLIATPLFALPLTACAGYAEPETAPPAPPVPAAPPEYVCNAAPAQYHIGHDATQGMGAAILKESGARTLRWGPPRTAWTMDYRQDRVNVRYGDDMKITEVSCG